MAAPGSFETGVTPYLVLASPSTTRAGYQPNLAMPPGEAMDTRAGERPGAPGGDATLPTRYRTLVDVTIHVDPARDERWTLVVDAPDQGGSYAVLADPPGASLSYVWNVPTERMEAYRWEGLALAEAWGAPIAGGAAAGAAVLLRWRAGREGRGPVTALAALSAVLLGASAASLADAAARFGGTILTAALVLAGAGAALAAIALATRPVRAPRAWALALAAASLLLTAGYLLGPVSLALGGLLPRETPKE